MKKVQKKNEKSYWQSSWRMIYFIHQVQDMKRKRKEDNKGTIIQTLGKITGEIRTQGICWRLGNIRAKRIAEAKQ